MANRRFNLILLLGSLVQLADAWLGGGSFLSLRGPFISFPCFGIGRGGQVGAPHSFCHGLQRAGASGLMSLSSRMPPASLVYDDRHMGHNAMGHPEKRERASAAWEALQDSGLVEQCLRVDGRQAPLPHNDSLMAPSALSLVQSCNRPEDCPPTE